MRYCGRDFPPEEMALIRRLIAGDPGRTRAELSRLLCARIGWYKADGGLKEMSARVAAGRRADSPAGSHLRTPTKSDSIDPRHRSRCPDRSAGSCPATVAAGAGGQTHSVAPVGRYLLDICSCNVLLRCIHAPILQYRHSPHPCGSTNISTAITTLATRPYTERSCACRYCR